ncbi:MULTISPECIES: aldo/keto reductase [unclassified Streptomyces]|uniref:aldo/keto reductase n=1 Tax=unclassified Streptomyces TaxID=2593676 RepID=UPI002DDA61C0|nr:aldo/keto reductase [Streptomyces sp. NBC_00243]WRZ25522.1 aldo/keto reductase [Streptomyces sp. NBC_00243]
MQYTRLGNSGLIVSRLGLGMMSYGNTSRRAWHLTEEEAEPIVRHAVEAGVTLFDTADMYDRGASEEVTGRLLAKLFDDRDDYVLATKVYYSMSEKPGARGLSRKHILASVDASLRRLGTDHIDLYQIHRWDDETPIEETMEALDAVVRAGKVRYLGASSMYAWQFAKAQYTAALAGGTRFAAMQNHYNLIYREEEREMIPLCLDQGVGILPYSPLARGFLAGSRARGDEHTTTRSGTDPLADTLYTEADFDIIDTLRTVASELGLPPAQTALAWLLGKEGVSAPIVGATRRTHLQDAVAALDVTLSPEQVERLEADYRPHPVAGPQ